MIWDPSPIAWQGGPLVIRWYGLCFAAGFVSTYLILRKIFVREGAQVTDLDRLLWYVIGGTVIGARLGHVLFYEPSEYFAHPLEILKVWKGGLASHGGTLGVIVAIWIYSKLTPHLQVRWLFDRVALVVPLAAAFIRLGNFMNSEILGSPSQVAWAVTFSRVDSIPRHPAQLYEALSYLLIFVIQIVWYSRGKQSSIRRPGFLLGFSLAMIFASRFMIEFIKERQVAFEQDLTWDMGQYLSLPFVAVGIGLMILALRPRSVRRSE